MMIDKKGQARLVKCAFTYFPTMIQILSHTKSPMMKNRPVIEKSPNDRKIAQWTKNFSMIEKSPNERKIAQWTKNRPMIEKSPNQVTLKLSVLSVSVGIVLRVHSCF
jgi:hypothetical protein